MNLFAISLSLFGCVSQLHSADPPPLPLGNGFSATAKEESSDALVYFELIDKAVYSSAGYLVNETNVSIQRNTTAYPEAPNAMLKDSNWTIYWDTLRGLTPDLYVLRGGTYKLPPRAKLATMLLTRLTTKQKNYTSMTFYGSISNWSSIMIDALVKAKVKIATVSFGGIGSTLKLNEKQLTDSIKTFKPSVFATGTTCELPLLSNKFFNLDPVRKLTSLKLVTDKAEINNDALSKLKATVLRVGRAPKLTLAGIRKFFMRLVNGNVAKGSMEFAIRNVTFAVDGKALFKDVSGVKPTVFSEKNGATYWKVTKGTQVFYLQHYVNVYYPDKPDTSLVMCKEAVCSPSWFT